MLDFPTSLVSSDSSYFVMEPSENFKEHHQKDRDHTGQGGPRSKHWSKGCGGTSEWTKRQSVLWARKGIGKLEGREEIFQVTVSKEEGKAGQSVSQALSAPRPNA